ncbi:MAG: LolA-like protein [Planctomycetota bacterium]|jgi:outer membrane lipoprotein-sorting protein
MYRSEDELQEIVNRLDIDTEPNPEHREKLRQEMLSVFEDSNEQIIGSEVEATTLSKRQKHNIMERLTTMKPIYKIAASIIVVLGFAGLLNLIIPGNKTNGVVLADVLAQIQKARTVTYNKTFNTEKLPPFTAETMLMEPDRMRYVLHGLGLITISDYNQGISMQLRPQQKKALITERVKRPTRIRIFNRLEWVSTLHDKNSEYIGQEDINGQITNVFVVEQEFQKTTVWADPQTNLPVKVEMINFPNPNKDIIMPKMSLSLKDFGGESGESTMISIGGDRGIQEKMTIVYSDFVWNSDLDPALFSLEPPEDYTVEKTQFDESPSNEDKLIETLQLYTDMSGGEFPAEINDLVNCRELLIKKYDKDGPPKQEWQQALKTMNTILKGLHFAQTLKAENNWHYAGKDVNFGDSDKPIFWYRPEGSQDYRVIYGDLSIKDVAAGELPQNP